MRTLRGVFALVLLLAGPVVGQQLDVVVSGGVSYRVVTADTDSTISTHATYHVALESAANFVLSSGRMAVILHTSETRVRAIDLPPVVVDPSPTPTDPPSTLPIVFATDFENAGDLGAFFELDGYRLADGQLVATIPAGSEFGGSAKLGLGAVPDPYFAPVGNPSVAYSDLRWCADLTVTGSRGVPHKAARVASFSDSDWSEAAVSHVWGSPAAPYLTTDPVSAVVGERVVSSGYNDFGAFRWLGQGQTTSDVVDGQPHRVCARQRLNTLGQTDGVLQVWVDGALELERRDLDWRGRYDGYGWNALFLESYYNGGPPSPVTMAWDNLEVRAAGTPLGTVPDPDPDPNPDPDPTGAWYVQSWDYESVQEMFASPEVSDATFPGGGAVELLTGLTGTPGGFTRAMRARFDGGRGTEPQVGVNLHPPRAAQDRPREVWLDFYTRWSTTWNVTGYPSHGSAGHKHLFLFDQRETGADGGRWELIYGSFNTEAYASISGETGPGRQRPAGVTSLWDGRWHRNQCHARMHPTEGTWQCTIGGYVISWGVGDTDFGASLYFDSVALSRNNNQGTQRTMSLDFGPVTIYTSDPGWN